MSQRAAVIGGGIFGINIALELDKIPGLKVVLYESESALMNKASKLNQNRIHIGYHYLRSSKTARQSMSGLLTFMFHYGSAVLYQFPNYYGIAKENSKTTAEEFIQFCQRLDIDYEEVYPDAGLMTPELLEASFKVPEPVFDYMTLRSIILDRLEESHVEIKLNHHCQNLKKRSGLFSLNVNDKTEEFDFVVNAAYKNFNMFNLDLGLNIQNLLYQDVFIPVFTYSSPKLGLTVMDGPFCSIMPKGFEDSRFLLSHVVHSVLDETYDGHQQLDASLTQDKIDNIVSKSAIYFPFLNDVHIDSYWRATKVLQRNDDDARLTELYVFDEVEDYFAVLSGKITTCCKVARNIQQIIKQKI